VKRFIPFLCLAALVAFAVPVVAADSQAAKAPSSDQVAAQVKALLTKEKIQTRFDLIRNLQAQGLTWQPTLTAPNDLVNRLSEDQLRCYAGIKLFDAIYAATFMQRQAVADAVQTIEQINQKLNVRSYADISGKVFATLKKAAAAPETANVQQLVSQLAADYAADVPALMASPKGAAYLADALYGFTVETGNTLAYFYRADLKGQGNVMKAVPQQKGGIADWLEVLLKVHESTGKANDTITVKGKPVQKMDMVKELIKIWRESDPAKQTANRASVYGQATAIREAILTPAAK